MGSSGATGSTNLLTGSFTTKVDVGLDVEDSSANQNPANTVSSASI